MHCILNFINSVTICSFSSGFSGISLLWKLYSCKVCGNELNAQPVRHISRAYKVFPVFFLNCTQFYFSILILLWWNLKNFAGCRSFIFINNEVWFRANLIKQQVGLFGTTTLPPITDYSKKSLHVKLWGPKGTHTDTLLVDPWKTICMRF